MYEVAPMAGIDSSGLVCGATYEVESETKKEVNMVGSESPQSQGSNVSNSSQYQQQNQISLLNQFAQSTQLSQLPSSNIQVPTQFLTDPTTAQYPHFQQELASQISDQSLLNAPSLPMSAPFSSQTSNDSKPTKRRGKASKDSKDSDTTQFQLIRRNYSVEEDVALTKAWLYVSIDSIEDKDQTSETMWNRIFKSWKKHIVNFDVTRNINGLSCRWSTIQSAVNKFHALYEGLERTPSSETTLDDLLKRAKAMYLELGDGPFKYEHCWSILRQNPKWTRHMLTKISKKQKSTTDSYLPPRFDGSLIGTPPPLIPSTPGLDNSSFLLVDDYMDLGTLGTKTTATEGVVCLPEEKSCKKRKRKLDEQSAMLSDLLTSFQSTLEKHLACNAEELELKKERNKKELELREEVMKKELELKEKSQKMKERAAIRREQERVMNTNLETLQPALRAAYLKRQAQIMAIWEEEGLFALPSSSSASGSHNDDVQM